MQREEILEHTRFVISSSLATNPDKADPSIQKKISDMFSMYNETFTPVLKKEREEFVRRTEYTVKNIDDIFKAIVEKNTKVSK